MNWRRVLGLVLFVTALCLLGTVNWRVSLGVFLLVWGNNYVYTAQLMETAKTRGAKL
jgi:hypothetical protein